MSLQIGTHILPNNVIAAPMAGVTDFCFRGLCSTLGAGMVVSEMVSSDPSLWQSKKSIMRTQHHAESNPRAVQIAGGDPEMMAQTAKYNVDKGAEIIDINMGCPAKKVCKKAAGSALLSNTDLVKQILDHVVAAVDVPVTLKIRTGSDPDHRNAIEVALIAQQAGIAALAIHGRTRADRFLGNAEYDTIKAVKAEISIPVIANGDIDTPEKAQAVLAYTKADAVMIGRAAQGNPWIFQQIAHFLTTGELQPAPELTTVKATMLDHLEGLYSLYGESLGIQIARKHIGWYCKKQFQAHELPAEFNKLTLAAQQQAFINNFLH
ncbi:MAG: tRNA dihydrouridine synthase DusB [Gammaproteobacteria bacterium]|nr:tRNA dihydrouridine synthase DusB [Gammaproteobacteria bacterium]